MIYPIWFQTPLYSFSVGKLGGKLMFWVVAHRAKVSVWGWVSNSLQPERAGKIPGAGKGLGALALCLSLLFHLLLGILGSPLLSGKPEPKCSIPREGVPSRARESEGRRKHQLEKKGRAWRPSLEGKELLANQGRADCTLICWAGTAQNLQVSVSLSVSLFL